MIDFFTSIGSFIMTPLYYLISVVLVAGLAGLAVHYLYGALGVGDDGRAAPIEAPEPGAACTGAIDGPGKTS